MLVYKAVTDQAAKSQVLSVLPWGNRLIILRVEVGCWPDLENYEDKLWWKQHSSTAIFWRDIEGDLEESFSVRKPTIVWFSLYLFNSSKLKQPGGCTLLTQKGKISKKILNFGLEASRGPFVTLVRGEYWYTTQELMSFTSFSLS